MDLSCKVTPRRRRWLTLSLLLLALGFIPAQKAAAQGVEVRVSVNGDHVFMIFPQPLDENFVPELGNFGERGPFVVYRGGVQFGFAAGNTRQIREVAISATDPRILRLTMMERLTPSEGTISARYTAPESDDTWYDTRLRYENGTTNPDEDGIATVPNAVESSSNRLGGLTFEPPAVLNFTLGVWRPHVAGTRG